jgi:hypothetical protein
MVDWNDSGKRKAFRLALQQVYPSREGLSLFVDEELNEDLGTLVEGGTHDEVVHQLIQRVNSQGRLEELYTAFKREHPSHPAISRLEQRDLVPPSPTQLTQGDWDSLFEHFMPGDLADLIRAFNRGFKQAVGIEFNRARPESMSLTGLIQIRELLERYDDGKQGPILAVRFVESVILELQRSDQLNERDLTPLGQWRDRITQQFQVPPPDPSPEQVAGNHAYLLVALEAHGADVNVYPELHITGAAKPIRFGGRPTTCRFDQVAEQLSEWIKQAETTSAVSDCENGEVTLEFFLPCDHLEEDIATTWKITDKRNDEIALGFHRWFLVRSFNRIGDRQLCKALTKRWKKLEAGERDDFHLIEDWPEELQEKGGLGASLKDLRVTVLQLVAPLPADAGKRRDLLNGIIDGAVPIALWSSGTEHGDASTLKADFDSLLTGDLTNFTELARQWRMRRRASASAKSIRLLCDRPDRWPNLADPNQESDLLVAS